MILGIDDTDSRTDGMCTTYLATRLAERLERDGATVTDRLLFRLNPNVPWKTRGNGCLALHVDASDLGEDAVWRTAVAAIERHAVLDDPDTNPGLALLTADERTDATVDALADHALRCVRRVVEPDDARALAEETGARFSIWGTGRGAVGAVAALGADRAIDRYGDETRELLAYRDDGWEEPRRYDADSFRMAHEATAPATWDTVDPASGDVVAVPNTDGPVLYGVRGESDGAVERAHRRIDCEDADRIGVFRTNQGTDMHLVPTPIEELPAAGTAATDGGLGDGAGAPALGSYVVGGTVTGAPTTREGGHVFLELDGALTCAAFEPTKRFRDAVRRLREGDRVTACGSLRDGTLRLEKLRVDALRRWQRVTPRCAGCGRTMGSAGADQGYRCRDCGTSAAGRVAVTLTRDLAAGWHEVPPGARRHLAMPLVRLRSGAAEPVVERRRDGAPDRDDVVRDDAGRASPPR